MISKKYLLIVLILLLSSFSGAVSINAPLLNDTFVASNGATTNNGGSASFSVMNSSNQVYKEASIRFNISFLPSNAIILSAYLNSFASANDLDAGESISISVNHIILHKNWSESSMTYNSGRILLSETNASDNNAITFDSTSPLVYYSWNVTNAIRKENEGNISFWYSANPVSGSTIGTDDIDFNSRESSVNVSFLNITYYTTDISECTNITVSAEYNITANINGTGTCINVNASNVIINGLNHEMYYGTKDDANTYGISASGINQLTVRNLNIFQNRSTGANGAGIFFTSISNSSIENNIIMMFNNSGVDIAGLSHRINITNNTVNASLNRGVQWLGSTVINSYSIISQNIITVFDNEGFRSNAVANNTIQNNIITVTGGTNRFGVVINGASGTNISSNNISVNGTGSVGIEIQASAYVLVDKNNVTLSAKGFPADGIRVNAVTTNSRIINNIVNMTQAGIRGFLVFGDSRGNNISQNQIILASGNSAGIEVQNSHDGIYERNDIISLGVASILRFDLGSNNNTFIRLNGTIKTTSSAGINLVRADANFSIFDSTFNQTGTFETMTIPQNSINGTYNFTNFTSNGKLPIITWNYGTNGTLNIMNYADIHTGVSNGTNLAGVGVSFYDSFLTRKNDTSDSNGDVPRLSLLYLTQRNGTSKLGKYFSNYTINGTFTSYDDATIYANLSTSISMNLFFTPSSSCGCVTSGDWNINPAHNCTISDNCGMNNANFYCIGFGRVTFLANVTGWINATTKSGCNTTEYKGGGLNRI